MSRNLAQHQKENTFINDLKRIGRHNTKVRTIQPQGSQAIRVESITGYQYLAVPSGTVAPNYVYIDLESDNPDEIMIASLTRSTFMRYTNGTFENIDLDTHGLGDDFWEVWLVYDERNDPDEILVPLDPTSTIDQRMHAEMAGVGIAHNRARIGIKVSRITTAAKPSTFDQYLITYQIRATIGGV